MLHKGRLCFAFVDLLDKKRHNTTENNEIQLHFDCEPAISTIVLNRAHFIVSLK